MSLVLGIAPPRSGTAWLSNFLTWGSSFFLHEAMFGVSDLTELEEKLNSLNKPIVGSVDTAAAFVAPALYKRFPDAKYILVVRQKNQVIQSQKTLGLNPDVTSIYRGLSWVYGNISPHQLHVLDYRTMFSQIEMQKLWEFIEHPDEFPFQRMEMLRGLYVEDGFKTGFGRFIDKKVVAENLNNFISLQKSCAPNVILAGTPELGKVLH
jgi:hypothetical protein